jgi:cytochrome oxidase assembly protein ShyY1
MSGRTARQQTALRWAGYVAIAIVFAIVCAFLSNWQFTRNADRSSQLALIAANYDAAPVPLDQVIGTDGTFRPADQWRPVSLTGQYLTDHTLLARNRAHGGTSAFEVLVPFRTGRRSGLPRRPRWLPPGSPAGAGHDPRPLGQVQVIARLKPGEPLPNSGRSAPDGQVPTINLPLVAETTAQPALITSAYGLLVSEQPSPRKRRTRSSRHRTTQARIFVRHPVDPLRTDGVRLHLVHDPHRDPSPARGCGRRGGGVRG